MRGPEKGAHNSLCLRLERQLGIIIAMERVPPEAALQRA
jgi:hypothetical protein